MVLVARLAEVLVVLVTIRALMVRQEIPLVVVVLVVITRVVTVTLF